MMCPADQADENTVGRFALRPGALDDDARFDPATANAHRHINIELRAFEIRGGLRVCHADVCRSLLAKEFRKPCQIDAEANLPLLHAHQGGRQRCLLPGSRKTDLYGPHGAQSGHLRHARRRSPIGSGIDDDAINDCGGPRAFPVVRA